MTPGAPSCESCGAPEPDDDLRLVHRIYLETDGQGRIVGERVLSDVERWCEPCRTLYPNRPADGPGPTDAGSSRSQADRRPPGDEAP